MQFSPGDLVEIETTGGLAYAQITHIHPAYPEVLRILKGLHAARPADLRQLDQRPTAFVTMFPLASALDRQELAGRKVGSLTVSSEHKAFPTFKMPIYDKRGNVAYWWLWDGDGLTYKVDLDGSYDAYPRREVPTVAEFLRDIRMLNAAEAVA